MVMAMTMTMLCMMWCEDDSDAGESEGHWGGRMKVQRGRMCVRERKGQGEVDLLRAFRSEQGRAGRGGNKETDRVIRLGSRRTNGRTRTSERVNQLVRRSVDRSGNANQMLASKRATESCHAADLGGRREWRGAVGGRDAGCCALPHTHTHTHTAS